MTLHDRIQTVIASEARAILDIDQGVLTEKLPQLVQMILECKGKLVLTGMGKNGHIGKRLAATFASTGTPSTFIDPPAALHGDLGMLSDGDIILALSNSGRTQEIIDMVERVKSYFPRVKIAVLTGHPEQKLNQYADISVSYGIIEEPCPFGLTPTASLAVMSALLDALALGVMEMRNFTLHDWSIRHKAGYLGQKAGRND